MDPNLYPNWIPYNKRIREDVDHVIDNVLLRILKGTVVEGPGRRIGHRYNLGHIKKKRGGKWSKNFSTDQKRIHPVVWYAIKIIKKDYY